MDSHPRPLSLYHLLLLCCVLLSKTDLSGAQSLDSCLRYYNSGSYTQVERLFEKDQRLREIVYDSSAIMDAVTTSYIRMGKNARAHAILVEVLKRHPLRLGASTILATAYNNLGLVFDGKKNLDSALYYLSLGLKGRLGHGESPAVSESYFNLGSLYVKAGDLDKGENLLLKSLHIDTRTLGPNDPVIGYTNSNLGAANDNCGRFSKALVYYSQAAKVFAVNPGRQSYEYALALFCKSRCFYNAMQPDSGGFYLEASRKLLARFPASFPEIGKIKFQTITRLLKIGEAAEAEALVAALDKEVSTSPEFMGPVKPYITEAKAALSFYKGNLQEALTYSSAAIEDRDRWGAFDANDYQFNDLQTNILMRLNKVSEGEAYLRKLNQQIMGTIVSQFPLFSDTEKEQFFLLVKRYFEKYNSLLLQGHQIPGVASEVYNNQLATKSILLNYTNRWKRQLLHSGDVELIRNFSQWQEMKGNLLHWGGGSAKQDSVKEVLNQLEKKMTSRSEYFARGTDKKLVKWQQVQQTLKKDEAVVEIIRFRGFDFQSKSDFGDKIYYAVLFITRDTKHDPELLLMDNGNELETKVIKNYTNSVVFKLEDAISYKALWAPIKAHLSGIKKVFISPDGIFNLINFNTLRNPATGKYVLDEIDLRRITNSKDLVRINDAEEFNNYAVLIGGPDFKMGKKSASKSVAESQNRGLPMNRNTTLSYLPGARKEVEQLEKVLVAHDWKVDMLVGQDALEGSLKHILKPKVLHIATHGFFQKDISYESNVRSVYNPFTSSGLLLAGAETFLQEGIDDPEQANNDDGILTSYEAMDLNLENTELVVLSACETGLGEVKNGEGVYGLQRAFHVAGAQFLMMSLWKVDDNVTQELMDLFYDYWLSGETKQNAFRKAQTGIKTKYPEPCYWGAFVLVGG